MPYWVSWSRYAENKLDKIFNYFCIEASEDVAIKLVLGIKEKIDALKSHHFIGQIEELLVNREFEYRYLVCRNHKIIYRVDKDEKLIRIVDIFDCRQNPTKMKDFT